MRRLPAAFRAGWHRSAPPLAAGCGLTVSAEVVEQFAMCGEHLGTQCIVFSHRQRRERVGAETCSERTTLDDGDLDARTEQLPGTVSLPTHSRHVWWRRRFRPS